MSFYSNMIKKINFTSLHSAAYEEKMDCDWLSDWCFDCNK